MRCLVLLLLSALVAALARSASASADETPIQAFFGTYEGRTLFPMGEAANRDLRVSIQAFDLFGFSISWETTTFKGKTKAATRKVHVMNFKPTPHPGVYAAVYPKDTPPDLIAGDPYAWARIEGKALTVNVFSLTENGDYVIQTYARTLTDGGLSLVFTRIRNGESEKQVKAKLKRIEEALPQPDDLGRSAQPVQAPRQTQSK